ncbi:MAG: hypothetical protein V3U65_16780 [Granulosicoccaceae bacterium]
MSNSTAAHTEVALRPAHHVMRLERMGSFHQSRLSFMRVLLRRIKQQKWQFSRPIFRIDDNGVGVATYSVAGPERTYTLIAFAHDLPADKRSDRVIAEAWDSTFTLFDGIPTEDDITRLAYNVPLQEAGRISESELSLSRANRSVRLFEYVVDTLSKGMQPDTENLEDVGYLMRTTAVYGSSKFGAADRAVWADRPEFAGSFRPELLAVWLIRTFTIDMVEHLARARGGENAIAIDPDIKRCIGVGNSTGLGMAPFLLNHPRLIHTWVHAREKALAIVRGVNQVQPHQAAEFSRLLASAQRNARYWCTAHPLQIERLAQLRVDLDKFSEHLQANPLKGTQPWNTLYLWVETNLGLEAQEQIISLMVEPYGELVDHLADTMQTDESLPYAINGTMTVAELLVAVEKNYQWAINTDFSQDDTIARVWYVSAEKLEPRLGERFDEPIEPYEQPLAPGREVADMYQVLQTLPADTTVAAMLCNHDEFRGAVRRVQMLQTFPYAEVRDNTISSKMLPIDLLRCKLSFFGATRFDPRSDRWVRITMYKGAPYPDELEKFDPDVLAYFIDDAA